MPLALLNLFCLFNRGETISDKIESRLLSEEDGCANNDCDSILFHWYDNQKDIAVKIIVMEL